MAGVGCTLKFPGKLRHFQSQIMFYFQYFNVQLLSKNIKQLTKGWKNVVNVQPSFYKGVDRYEQAWKADRVINFMNYIKTLLLVS